MVAVCDVLVDSCYGSMYNESALGPLFLCRPHSTKDNNIGALILLFIHVWLQADGHTSKTIEGNLSHILHVTLPYHQQNLFYISKNGNTHTSYSETANYLRLVAGDPTNCARATNRRLTRYTQRIETPNEVLNKYAHRPANAYDVLLIL